MLVHSPLQLSCITFLILLSWNELMTFLFCSFKVIMNWNINEGVLWWFSFLWTTSDLLPPLIVLLFCLWVCHLDWLGVRFWLLLIRITVFICLSHEICFSNVSSELWRYAETIFWENNFLFNQLNKIHPPLFYALMGWLLGTTFLQIRTQNRVTSPSSLLPLSINLLLLLFGSWWAFQEGTWGGWWNWDSSEVLGLIILIVLVGNFHNSFLNEGKMRSKFLLLLQKMPSIVAIIAFLVLQLNFIQSSHSFGIQFNYLFLRDTSIMQELLITFSFLLMHQVKTNKLIRTLKLISVWKRSHCENFLQFFSILIVLIISLPFIPTLLRNYIFLCKDLMWIFPLNELIPPLSVMMIMFLLVIYNNSKITSADPLLLCVFLSVSPFWSVAIVIGGLAIKKGFVHYLFCISVIFAMSLQSLLPPVWDFLPMANCLATPLSCRDVFVVMRQLGESGNISLAFINVDGSPLFLSFVALITALCLIIRFI